MLPQRRDLLWYSMHPNMISTTLTSMKQETFPHFLGVGTSPRFHGLGIFDGIRCTLTCTIQPSSLPWCRNFSTLPQRRTLLQYSMHNNQLSGTLLPRCRKFSTLPRYRNLLWYSMHNNRLNTTLLTFTVQELFHTSATQESFMVLNAQQHAQYKPPHLHSVGTSFSKYQGFQNTSLRIQIWQWLSNHTSL